MSAIIYSEANMECYAGKKAVGIVIMNRIKSSSFPNTLYNVIYQPYQFGPVRNGSLNRSLSLYDSGKINSQCIKAAKASLNGDKVVSYKGKSISMSSYLYFSGYVSGARLSIQGHQFK
jgi:spore germination cell wall hydrolase CwlJ-like protein